LKPPSQKFYAEPLSVLLQYEADLNAGLIMPDPAQAKLVKALQKRHEMLARLWQQGSAWHGIFSFFQDGEAHEKSKGLYIWGGVGRGKTYLMDLFYSGLSSDRKLRVHFHRFMLQLHRDLQQLQGQTNPLVGIAKELSEKVDVICFDEFFVSDIGDAMLLGPLLSLLFERGVILIATSNIKPESLYERGLQRGSFLPAIAAIIEHTEVFELVAAQDYRLRSMNKTGTFFHPLNSENHHLLCSLFSELSMVSDISPGVLEVCSRKLPVEGLHSNLVWFKFSTLCEGPRAAADYIELANHYHTVFLSDVPVLTEQKDDAARRFISLVDEFYDHRVKLVLSAATALNELYQGSELKFAFERCESRLLEMQTREYLSLPHATK
jgi:cell division protein ZapE